jgi:hypothetical protein
MLTSLTAEAGGWPTGVAARRDAALLLIGFAGAHRRSELVALTLADVTLHGTDGLHVRLRRSKTDQEARGAVKALPYGRDPVTCPPCAYVRWRQILLAWDTAAAPCCRSCAAKPPPRRPMRERKGRRKSRCCTAAAAPGSPTRPTRPDPTRALFPTVHKTGAIGQQAMTVVFHGKCARTR